jgi:lipoprotein signal peptidase
MSVIYNILLLAFVFVILKTFQIIFDFAYTTYKSVTIHKNWEHAFNPGLAYRLKRGLYGDIVYFVAGIVVALNADAIRGIIAG